MLVSWHDLCCAEPHQRERQAAESVAAEQLGLKCQELAGSMDSGWSKSERHFAGSVYDSAWPLPHFENRDDRGMDRGDSPAPPS